MRTAVVSDIHGNLSALAAVAADLAGIAPDVVVIGGDLVANGARPAEVVDFVRERRWPAVLGNTDEMLWRPELLEPLLARAPGRGQLRRLLFDEVAPFTASLLGAERLAWLRRLPQSWSGGGVTVWHASPNDLWRAPLADAAAEDLASVFGVADTKVVVYGHIHHPFVRLVPPRTIVNAGSVGLSYDGDTRAAYAVVDERGAFIRRVAYDVPAEARRLVDGGHPRGDWLARILLSGRYLPPGPPGAVGSR
ncbi:MAG: metallophosphoesterase [Vicinamibacterales bacterium]